MTAADFVIGNWQQILAVLAFVVWAIRLEAKVNQNIDEARNEAKRLEKKIDDSEEKRSKQRSEDMASINQALRDIQIDIKMLLKGNK